MRRSNLSFHYLFREAALPPVQHPAKSLGDRPPTRRSSLPGQRKYRLFGTQGQGFAGIA
jgi:hypothetical protein